jgi:hypothetical protein
MTRTSIGTASARPIIYSILFYSILFYSNTTTPVKMFSLALLFAMIRNEQFGTVMNDQDIYLRNMK